MNKLLMGIILIVGLWPAGQLLTDTPESKYVIRIFSGKYCVPCRKQEEIMKRPAVKKELQQYKEIKYLDVDDFAEFKKYNVDIVPYLIIEKGKESKRLRGLQTEESILKILKDE